MPVDVKKILLGILLLIIAGYIAEVPNSYLASVPFVKQVAGGLCVVSIILFLLEGGFRLIKLSADTADTVIGIFMLIFGFSIAGTIVWVGALNGYVEPFITFLTGLILYLFLIRLPIKNLLKI
jgi:hypothetical protein